MKKDKKSIGLALLEGIGELLLTLVCFGIGASIISLFGVDLELQNIDYDLIILLGLAVFFVVFVIIFAFVQWIKKILREKHK